MTKPPQISFSHVGIFVIDPARMEAFYTRLFGFTVTDRGRLATPRGAVDLVFLSRDPGEHHQLVLCSGRPPELPFNVINQLSFRVGSLGELCSLYRQLATEPVSEISPVTHGNAVSVYFRDPEGNRIELFVDTPWYVTQPLREPIDLTLPEAEILATVEAMARKLPGFKPRAEWRAEMARRMDAA
ncbi:MAG: VOC family protein [Burkholderiales bacterium]|nr:VOC family protein [Burkholderiales bacterium]